MTVKFDQAGRFGQSLGQAAQALEVRLDRLGVGASVYGIIVHEPGDCRSNPRGVAAVTDRRALVSDD
ncbi:hypothetical protein O7623_22255 [Solwaraspora sp. WMMD791]|uniref:hypothetical protein n=1 Tax=Solwaraspora sp. WMMD791 TaxID=3016086 RepID=UPI00249CCB6C|nr:hypothetical protein [Solwaraspora sp. WMMD791]WFE26062.1 hypothetical protein O7623_22255 [Solwaraspora sp. WMMD791]